MASCIKIEMEADPIGKVRFYDYPSITVIRRFWRAVVHACAERWQSEGNAPLVTWKALAVTDPWKAFAEGPGSTDQMKAMQNAMSSAMAEMAQAKAALRGQAGKRGGLIETMKAKFPGYALVKVFQDAQAAGNLDLAAELAAELKDKYLSCAGAAKAALEAEAAKEQPDGAA